MLCFRRAAMRIVVSKTTANVENDENELGRYIAPTINNRARIGGTFASQNLIIAYLWYPTNIRQPDAISQNLEGIMKYAAG